MLQISVYVLIYLYKNLYIFSIYYILIKYILYIEKTVTTVTTVTNRITEPFVSVTVVKTSWTQLLQTVTNGFVEPNHLEQR